MGLIINVIINTQCANTSRDPLMSIDIIRRITRKDRFQRSVSMACMYEYKIRNQTYHPCFSEIFKIIIIILLSFHDIGTTSWWIVVSRTKAAGSSVQIVTQFRWIDGGSRNKSSPSSSLSLLVSPFSLSPFRRPCPVIYARPHWKHLVLETGFKRSNELWSWANWDCGKTRLYPSLSEPVYGAATGVTRGCFIALRALIILNREIERGGSEKMSTRRKKK